MTRFSEILKQEMQRNNYSYCDLANITGLSDHQLRRYIRGISEPTATTLMALATALNMSLDELTGYSKMTLSERLKVNHGRPNTTVAINGEMIKKQMKSRGIRYKRLATETGYSESYLAGSISNDRMSAEMIKAVCKALNIAEEDLRK